MAHGQSTSDHWGKYALCSGGDTNWFYEKYERGGSIAEAVDEMCLSCPVIKQCNALRKATGSPGGWAGVYWNKLGQPDKSFNSHKTPETWERIRDALND